MGKIAIFIPVYNEDQTLAGVLSRVPPVILGRETNIFVVDDCSEDGSAAIAKHFAFHVGVLPVHSGVGAATKEGLETICSYPGYDYVIKFDGDGQHDLNKLTEVAGMLIEGSDLIVCSRFHPFSDQTHTPVDRILLNMIFTEMVRKITGWQVTDVRSGFMGFRFGLLSEFAHKILVQGYGVPMELVLRAWHAKPDARVSEIPHPAVYGGDISEKLKRKYTEEKIDDKANRLQAAFGALLAVVEDLNIPKEDILEMNGFLKK